MAFSKCSANQLTNLKGERLTKEELEDMIYVADADGDGLISLNDFQSMMESTLAGGYN